ncbi:MAG TPA: hypothetical protein VKH45_02670 [Candidatus Acidoferrum sp.]|nr:hypothetical protein [Candidatus Acidoferrum sp.]
MSIDPKKSGHTGIRLPLNEDVFFETKDVKPSPIYKFLTVLGIAVVLSYVLTLVIYRGLTSYWKSTYTEAPPSREGMTPTMPPEPRLQGMSGHLTDPQQDWRRMVKADNDANNELGWVDQQAGVARIPVRDAMDLIVRKGLPSVPAMPAEKK